jgi:hypothetical protein
MILEEGDVTTYKIKVVIMYLAGFYVRAGQMHAYRNFGAIVQNTQIKPYLSH